MNGLDIGFHPQIQKLEPAKYIVRPCETTAQEVSFEWSHHKISSTDSKIRAAYTKFSIAEEVSYEWSHHRISFTDSKIRAAYKI